MTEKVYPRSPKFMDLAGQKFGRLVAKTPVFKRNTAWICVCDCGALKEVAAHRLRSGATQSCGCYQKERAAQTQHKHGRTDHPMYGVWKAALRRCEDPKDPAYANYGGRGITVSEAWHDIRQFFADMEPSWHKGLELDRIDNEGPYSKENCRWVTHMDNNRNKRTNVLNWPLVHSIRGRRWNGEGARALARDLGLTYAAVSACLTWRSWKPRWEKPAFTIIPKD